MWILNFVLLGAEETGMVNVTEHFELSVHASQFIWASIRIHVHILFILSKECQKLLSLFVLFTFSLVLLKCYVHLSQTNYPVTKREVRKGEWGGKKRRKRDRAI